MYAWIWRKLPYGAPGKIVGIVLFLAGLAGLLWYVAFPFADRHLPNNNVQVTQDDGVFVAPPTPTIAPSAMPALPK